MFHYADRYELVLQIKEICKECHKECFIHDVANTLTNDNIRVILKSEINKKRYFKKLQNCNYFRMQFNLTTGKHPLI